MSTFLGLARYLIISGERRTGYHAFIEEEIRKGTLSSDVYEAIIIEDAEFEIIEPKRLKPPTYMLDPKEKTEQEEVVENDEVVEIDEDEELDEDDFDDDDE